MGEYLNIIPQRDCTGCGACSAICPHNCIDMDEDRFGFTIPNVDPICCIHCGMCEKACPVLNFDLRAIQDKSVAVNAAKNAESEVALNSSSGGIFSILAEEIITRGGVVYGVGITPALTAKHMRVDNVDDL